MRPRFIPAAIAAGIASWSIAGSIANAQPTHRRSSAPLEIELASPARAARTPAPKTDGRPISSERYLEAMAQSADFRDATIRKLTRLVQSTPADHPERAELLFRLAEAHAAKHRFYRMRALQLGERAAAATGQRRRRLSRQRRAHERIAGAAVTRAIAVFAALTGDRSLATYPRMDAALFAYAHTLRRDGRGELALSVFRRLVRRYPQSPLVGHAYLAFAEHHFAAGELGAADRFYRAVLSAPKVSVADYALYKRGWVQLNLGEPRAALEIFYDAARRAGTDSDLGRRAAVDFARTYAEVGRPGRALAAFRRVDRRRALELLERLALRYVEMGKHAAAVGTLRELIRRRPDAPELCDWALAIHRAIAASGTKAQLVAESLALIEIWRRVSGSRASRTIKSACADDTRLAVGELAKQWHYEVDRTHDDAVYDHAEALYRAYLGAFTGAADAPRMRFHLGDLLWRRAERSANVARARRLWRASADVFDELVKRRRATPALIREAAYAAVLGRLNALRLDPTSRPPDPGRAAPRARPIRGDHAALLRSLERYTATVPRRRGDDQRVDIELLGARTLWRHDHLDAALPRLERIVREHPGHRAAGHAANMILDALVRLDRIDALAATAASMARSEALVASRPELAARLASIALLTARKRAERLEERGRWLACGEAYLAIAREHPTASGIDEVLYNAAVCYHRARSVGYALSLWRQLRREFPDSPLAERALLRLGRASAQIASYAEAARYYETYARRYAGERDAAPALSDAVSFRRALGDHREAIDDIEYFLRAFADKRPSEAAEALLGLAAIHWARGDRRAVEATLARYVRQIREAGGLDRLIAVHARLGELAWEQSCGITGAGGLCARPSRPRRSAAAMCGGVERPLIATARRDPRLVARARRHFERALALARRGRAALGELPRPRRAAASYWINAARFYLAEVAIERFYALELPALSFDPRNPARLAASRRAFARWIAEASARGETASAAYAAILKGDSVEWAIAAAARMGQIPAAIADGVYRAGVPREVAQSPEAVDRYCAELERQTAPLEARAVAAFGMCLREATRRGANRRWSALCEGELERLRPRAHPADRERVGEADRVAPVVDSAGPALAVSE